MTLPELHLADWGATKDTLHLYGQNVGRIRLATTAPRNHWWNVPLYWEDGADEYAALVTNWWREGYATATAFSELC